MLYTSFGLVAMTGEPYALEENFARLEEYTREAVRRRATFIVAPEGAIDGYPQCAQPDKRRMLEIAETVPDGPYLRRAAELSRSLGIYFCFGFLERRGEELFNTAALYNPAGKLVATYSKVHPCGESFITPGRELRTFETPLGRMGMLICSDRHVVDNFGTLGAQGAGIILLPMNGTGGPGNTAIMKQRARDNRCYLAIANSSSSVIIDPSGEVVMERYETECVAVGHIHHTSIPRGPERDHFMQRRPDLYAPLTRTVEPEMHFDMDGHPTEVEEKSRRELQERMRGTGL